MSEMIDPQVFADHGRMATHQWRHTIKVRHLFSDDPTHDSVDTLCRAVIRGIDSVIASENPRRDSDESVYYISQLESLKADFDVLIGSSDMDIDELVKEFDYHLNDLYDLGDRKINLRDGKLQKFMWIG